ncbi:ferredoxin--NADP reductase [Smaragdicoccus niigatensis]|uniref:ferredoxin--NADP reductase n=1 Tax=Smaragdicoccus niigatensis TaxID=359359 RepID=UPI0004758904|nr:ferredoxin--NADP reductase [Smaragdicoccus niigatensis]
MNEVTSGARSLRVCATVQETPDAVSIVFDAGAIDVPYRPGQFLTVRVCGEFGALARCYSLSSAPGVDDRLQITVKRTRAGRASNWICDNVTDGSYLDVLPPSGQFVPRRWDVDFLLFAGGSGITPLLSILKAALHEHQNKVTLVFANTDARSVIFAAQLDDLARRFPDRLDVVHWLESERGLPTVTGLRTMIRPPRGHVFLCGPGPFMAVVNDYLEGVDVGRDRVTTETFTSLRNDVFEGAPAVVPAPDDSHGTRLLAEINGDSHRLTWPRDVPLLDVLLAARLDPEYVCREGSCGSCAYTLVSGEVKMLANDTLDTYELNKGIRLACQSVPIDDNVHVRFDQ